VTQRLVAAFASPIAIVRASAGSGKSVALRDFLKRYWRPYLVYDVTPEHGTFARFVRGFSEAVGEYAPGARLSFGSAYERAMQARSPGTHLAAWLLEHLRACEQTIVVDNVHNTDLSGHTGEFLAHLVDNAPERLQWAIACRSADAFPVPRWMASNRMGVPVDDADLAFTAISIANLSRHLGLALSAHEYDGVLERTGGWATGVSFLLHGDAAGRREAEPIHAYEPVIERALGRCDSWELRALLSTAYLPDLSGEFLAGSDVTEAVARLHGRAPYLFEQTGPVPRYHDLLLGALRERLRTVDARERAGAVAIAGKALRRRSRFAEALELYTESNSGEAAIQILEYHGIELVERGYADVVEHALLRLEKNGDAQSARALALRAIVESRLGRFDTAESWFNQALAIATDDDVRMVEIKYLYACDLVRRYRLDCIPLLREHAYDDKLSSGLRAALLSALGQALIIAEEPDAARQAIERARALVESSLDDDLVARVLTRASYVYVYCGETDRARECALAAAAAAERASMFSIAAGAYSVLYVIAFDAEQPVLALAYLERLLENGIKSGNLQFHFYYLANALEIEAERHNLPALERVDAALQSFDLHFDDTDSREALLPGDAMRASWSGGFDRSFRLLHPTAVNQAGFDRTALRWAEIAVYAAGALRPDTFGAIESARAAIAQSEPSNRRSRARILVALASCLSGRSDICDLMLGTIDEETALPPRLAALRTAVVAVRERLGGAENHATVEAALSELRAHEFGGFAALLEALPFRAIVEAASAAEVLA
jgi:ATP/maltotriose-dependent transcriptional regulator MalT